MHTPQDTSTSIKLTDEQAQAMAKPFTIDPAVRKQFESHIEILSELANEHNIPFLVAAAYSRQIEETEESIKQCFEMQASACFPGQRTPMEMRKAQNVLRQEESNNSLDRLLQALSKRMD